MILAGAFLSAGTIEFNSSNREFLPQTSIKALFNAYCGFAANDDFEGMYLLMSPEFRNKNKFAKFEKAMEDDLKISGGLKGCSKPEKVRDNGRYSSWRVSLKYNNRRMTPRTVVVDIVKIKGRYYFNNGMLMPVAVFGKF